MRPNYHYAPASNWLSDPNGLVHHKGEWHLFYQYNPHGEDWGHMSWGHAISKDLCQWQERPPALLEDDRFMIFSGSAVCDAEGTAGFGKDALVAVYTGAQLGPDPLQAQCLAWSNDAGRSWESTPAIRCWTWAWRTFAIPTCSGTNRPAAGSWWWSCPTNSAP